MEWYQSSINISRHRKTINLSDLLGLTIRDTVGLLHMFWSLVGEQFEDGNISKMSAKLLQNACNYRLKRGSNQGTNGLLNALVQSGFVDKQGEGEMATLIVHDWYSRNGSYLRDRERKRESRKNKDEIDF